MNQADQNQPADGGQRDPLATRPLGRVKPEIPETVGRYRVVRLLGQGGFGCVYLAHDDGLQRQVAIKVPHPEVLAGPGDADAYLAEARTVAGLDHPNIVPVYDVGQHRRDAPATSSRKYIEGSDLAERLGASRLSRSVKRPTWSRPWPRRCTTPTRRGWSTATSSRATSCSTAAASRSWPTSGWRCKENDYGRGAEFCGHAGLHEPRAGPRRGAPGRWPLRHLQPGRRASTSCSPGRRPFRGDSRAELLEQIAKAEPRPPRQVDDAIPQGAGADLPQGPGEAGLGALHDGQGHGRRPAALPGRTQRGWTTRRSQPALGQRLEITSPRRRHDGPHAREQLRRSVQPAAADRAQGPAVVRRARRRLLPGAAARRRATATGCPRASASGRRGSRRPTRTRPSPSA